jgi:HPt (histidine-containing phosphotransfer) domain-containing protein
MNLNEEITTNKYSGIELLDDETLTMLRGFAKDNQEMIRDIIDSFEPEASEIIADIKRAVAHCDPDLLRTATHSLAGISGSIGANRLRQVCSDTENLIKSGHTDQAYKNLVHLYSIYFDLIELMRNL